MTTERPFNGVVMIADGPRVVHAKVSGHADRERSVPLTLARRFVIGSLSKQITAALVMQQVDQGKIDLDAPISTYLSAGADWARRVKVRHLLNHTSGIIDLGSPLKSEPGTTFAYSNLGYDLLGTIVERVSGEGFATVASRLFASCGMTETAALDASNNPGLSVGYSEEADGTLVVASPSPMSEHAPSGGMVSSVGDLVRWNMCLHGGRAVSSESYAAMMKPAVTRPYRWGELGYGFGVQVSEQDGLTEISHGGYVEGFIATMAYYPQSRRTLVILENVSWRAEDMRRAFAPHDKLREAVRAELRRSPRAGARSPAP